MKKQDKNQYWLLESNGDLSVTFQEKELPALIELLKEDFNEEEEKEEVQYTITPIWLTQEEYEALDND